MQIRKGRRHVTDLAHAHTQLSLDHWSLSVIVASVLVRTQVLYGMWGKRGGMRDGQGILACGERA
jgi:hypothetical protein